MGYKHFLISLTLLAMVAVTAEPLRAHGSRVRPLQQSDTKPDQKSNDQAAQSPDRERIYTGKEVDKRPVVKSKPQPEYTPQAIRNNTGGSVVIRCVFAATGKVTNILVVTGLPDGLNEAAKDAATRIKFKPALKDGKPVSMWMELQYKFHP